MKYKLKFRVTIPADTEGQNSKKYSVSIEEGQTFTLGKFVPGVDHPIACLTVRDGCIQATQKAGLEDLDVNGRHGTDFTLKATDILKSGGYTVEFLEVPYTAPPVQNETQFLDISAAGVLSTPISPHDEATRVGTPLLRKQNTDKSSDKRAAPEDRNFGVRRPSPIAMEITSMLPRRVQDNSQDRLQLVTSFFMILIASALTASFGGLGSPLIGGALGTVGLALLAYGLYSLKNITTATGDFSQHLRFIAISSFALIPWAFVHKTSPNGSLIVAVMMAGGLYYGLSSFLKIEGQKAWTAAGVLAALPVLAAFATPVLFRAHSPSFSTDPEGTAVEPSPIPSAVPAPAMPSPEAALSPEAVPAPVVPPPIPTTRVQADVPDPLGAEELFTAIRAGNVGVVRSLVLSGAADPGFNLDRGSTPLMIAAQTGRESIVRFLLSRKVAINAKDPSGTTALMWAVLKDRYTIAKILIENGANPGMARDNGQTALDIAKRWNNRMMISLLQGERMTRTLAGGKMKRKRRSTSSHRSNH